MYLNRQILSVLAVASAMSAQAYDFAGNGIYYNIVSQDARTVEVTSNGNNTYSGKVNIGSVVNHGGESYTVVGVGVSAFSGSERVSSVTLPSTVTYIGDKAFFRCTVLADINMPVGLESVGAQSFQECNSLAGVELPESVTAIGASAFSRCAGLKSAKLSPNIKSLPGGVFYNATSLESVEIPEGVVSVGSQVFQGCTSLTTVTLPNSVTSLGDHLFSSCDKLASVKLPASITSLPQYLFGYCTSLTDIVIPTGVKELGQRAFTGCTSLPSINIPEGVTAIPYGAFAECSSLATVSLPAGLTSIDEMAFDGCSSLAMVGLPATLTQIGVRSFYGCSSLTSITLPSSLTKVGYNAFDNCTSLSALVVEPSSEPLQFGWDKSNSSNYVKFTGLPLQSIVLGRDITYRQGSTPTSYSPFKGASETLVNVIVGDDVTDAELLCLNDKSKLSAVEFGTGLEEIPSMNRCSLLKEITLGSAVPQKASEFTDEQYKTVILNVPYGSAEAYRKAEVWSNFKNIVELDMSSIDAVNTGSVSISVHAGMLEISGADGCVVDVFNATSGVRIYGSPCYDGKAIALPAGVYVVRAGDAVTKVAL
ncbi:MAG: leucine-rich repeat domain-containing protein [Pseudoflavonifractor sp.]|nr:leucine-rich repeat domain-containing protein [Pseudoflavonifractor sp.]